MLVWVSRRSIQVQRIVGVREIQLAVDIELAILNQVDRFNLVIDVLDRVPRLQGRTTYLREDMKNAIISNLNHAHTHGIDRAEITDWVWPD